MRRCRTFFPCFSIKRTNSIVLSGFFIRNTFLAMLPVFGSARGGKTAGLPPGLQNEIYLPMQRIFRMVPNFFAALHRDHPLFYLADEALGHIGDALIEASRIEAARFRQNGFKRNHPRPGLEHPPNGIRIENSPKHLRENLRQSRKALVDKMLSDAWVFVRRGRPNGSARTLEEDAESYGEFRRIAPGVGP